MKGARGLPLGYLGCKFLESPGNPNNGIDNDGDGLVDERQDDGIDNDGDWSALTDDVGIDGIPNTQDQGEGNGFPDAGKRLPDGSLDPLYPGEPNFELTDLDESDQIGLTSFNSWTWNTDKISNDESMWNRSVPRNFGAIQQSADIVFIFGSGYISLAPRETKRISMALLLAEDLDGLLTTAKTVQTIYNKNYQFFRPPITPHLTAVPDDKKVTLYWDTMAEQSVDPITGKDFEGYVIYRSTDPAFNDIQTVTDGKGARFLTEPLKMSKAARRNGMSPCARDVHRCERERQVRLRANRSSTSTRTGGGRRKWRIPGRDIIPCRIRTAASSTTWGTTAAWCIRSWTPTTSSTVRRTTMRSWPMTTATRSGFRRRRPRRRSPWIRSRRVLKFDVNTAQVIPGPACERLCAAFDSLPRTSHTTRGSAQDLCGSES